MKEDLRRFHTSRAKTTIATWFFWLAATSFKEWTPRPIALAGGRSSQTGSLILSVQSLDKGYIALLPSRRTATVSFWKDKIRILIQNHTYKSSSSTSNKWLQTVNINSSLSTFLEVCEILKGISF